MRNTRLSALLSQHVTATGLESDAPAEAVVEETPAAPAEEIPAATEEASAAPAAEETPAEVAVVEEPVATETPAEEAPVAPAQETYPATEDAAETPAEVPAEAPVTEEVPTAPAEEAPAAEVAAVETAPTEEVVVETPADLPSDLPADAVVEPAPADSEQTVSQEGAGMGFLAGLIPVVSTIYGAKVGSEIQEKSKLLKEKEDELKALHEEYASALKEAAKTKKVDVSTEGLGGVLAGGFLGTFFGPIANAIMGHQADKYQSKIDAKEKEIAALREDMLKTIKTSKAVSTEGEGDEVVVATPEQDAAQGEAEAVVAAQADAETAADETPIAEEPVAAETPAEAAPIEEAVEAAPAVESPSYEEVAVDDSDLNEALADQAEAEGEVKEVEETHDQLKRAADSLESIALSMESALNDGGLHPQAAKFMQIAVESQLNAIGVEQPVIPSLESFGGMSARMRATQVSLEGIKETIAKVWEQIVAILKKLRDAAIAFFKRVFTSVGRLRDYLEALEKKLETTGDKTSTIELVVPAALANRLAIGEKLPRDLAGVIEDIVAVALDSTEFDKEVAEQLKKDHDAVVDAVATGDAEAAAKIMKNFVRMPKSFKRETQEQKFGADVNTYLTAILPGNVRIGIGEYKTEVLGVSIAYLNTGTFREETAFEDGVKMPMLSKSDIKKVIAASKQACVAVGAMEHLADGEFKAASAAVADLKVGENASQMTALLSAYRQRGKVLMQLSQRIAGHAVTTAGAAAKVAHMAVEQYEAK